MAISLADKDRAFPFLDGIRGVAAAFVLARHTAEFWIVEFYRSYLAVDLFFMLSGFVLAYAYDQKLQGGRMSIRQFAVVRLIRLYPVYLLSLLASVAGALLIGGSLGEGPPPSVFQIAASALPTLVFLPSFVSGMHALFPLNTPYWSLFYEMLANYLYAHFRPKLNDRALLGSILLSGTVVAALTFHYGRLNFGFNWGFRSITGGVARSVFGFFYGLLLFRNRTIILESMERFFRGPLSPAISCVAIAAILASPSAGWLDPVIDLLVVGLASPLLITAATRGKPGRWQPLILGLGAASYPMYVMHVPLDRILSNTARRAMVYYAPLSGMAFLVVVTLLCILIERSLDLPIRRILSTRCKERLARSPAKSAG